MSSDVHNSKTQLTEDKTELIENILGCKIQDVTETDDVTQDNLFNNIGLCKDVFTT